MNTIIEKDKFYSKAKRIVQSDKNCSISCLQIKLQIGYNRAKMIIELLEKTGLLVLLIKIKFVKYFNNKNNLDKRL